MDRKHCWGGEVLAARKRVSIYLSYSSGGGGHVFFTYHGKGPSVLAVHGGIFGAEDGDGETPADEGEDDLEDVDDQLVERDPFCIYFELFEHGGGGLLKETETETEGSEGGRRTSAEVDKKQQKPVLGEMRERKIWAQRRLVFFLFAQGGGPAKEDFPNKTAGNPIRKIEEWPVSEVGRGRGTGGRR